MAVVVVAILEVVFGSAWVACFGTQIRSLVLDLHPFWVACPTFRVAGCLLRHSRWCGRGASVASHLRVAFAPPSIACLFDHHACIQRTVHAHGDVSIVADPGVSVLPVHTHSRPPFSFFSIRFRVRSLPCFAQVSSSLLPCSAGAPGGGRTSCGCAIAQATTCDGVGSLPRWDRTCHPSHPDRSGLIGRSRPNRSEEASLSKPRTNPKNLEKKTRPEEEPTGAEGPKPRAPGAEDRGRGEGDGGGRWRCRWQKARASCCYG